MGVCYYGPGVLSVGQLVGSGTVKSKNRAGSGNSSALRMVFCPLVVAERCAEVVPAVVELEVAVPRLMPAVR